MSSEQVTVTLILLSGAFIASMSGILLYRSIAIKFSIIAVKNFRTLHDRDVPKGGGIVFSLVFILFSGFIWYLRIIPNDLGFVICVGGLAATIFGFIDDLFNIPAKFKLLVQISLSCFIIFYFGHTLLLLSTSSPPVDAGYLGMLVGIGVLVWLINLYNFMDGADGMAASGTVFICMVISTVLFSTNNYELGLLVAILACVCLGFLVFNWPPASIFMGDSGSVFIGYIFGVLIVYTMMHGQISIWTWITVFAYFGIDTTMTLLLRIILVKKWYGAHRSHAYQNLARVWSNHRKILYCVLCYHLLWILPLTIMSVTYEKHQELICFIAVLPVILWTLKYGPLFSKD